MSTALQEFIDFFDLSDLFGSGVVTVQQSIGLMCVAFIGAIFSVVGLRCVFELVKIFCDWTKFR